MKSKASVAIIGGGIIGASIAYNLASNGENDVIVFDKGKLGGGSTSAALGGFRYQFSNELSIRFSQESIDFFDKFQELIGYDPLVKHDGYIFVASRESSGLHLRQNVDLQRKLGVQVELVSNEGLAGQFPFYNFCGILGGTYCAADGHASTLAVHQGFVSKAKELGVEFYENSAVTGINPGNPGSITVSGTKIECQKIVIAAGAFSRLVGRLAGVEIPIDPVPRRVLITRSFSDGIPENFPLIIDVDSTLAIGREGKGIVIGDNEETHKGFDLEFSPDYDERLMSKAIDRVPVLSGASISYANQGLYEMTPDANPIVSAVPEMEGLYCCAGFAGHGFMHSPAIGKIMAEMLLGEKTHIDVSSLHIDRFKNFELQKERLII